MADLKNIFDVANAVSRRDAISGDFLMFATFIFVNMLHTSILVFLYFSGSDESYDIWTLILLYSCIIIGNGFNTYMCIILHYH